jgi:hypothetical protein
MRAPPTPQEHFVRSIADALQPWKCSEERTLTAVRRTIDALRGMVEGQTSLGIASENKKTAKSVLTAIAKLKYVLRLAPPETLRCLFVPVMDEIGAAEAEAEGHERMQALFDELEQLRARCENLRRYDIGNDPRFERDQHLAAGMALKLVTEISSKAPTSNSHNDPLRVVACFLYEAATGKAVNDLERACDTALARFKGRK